MSTIHDFLARATRKAADEIIAAIARIPEEKRDWSPGGKARTAIDLFAECVILNGYTVDLIQNRVWADEKYASYGEDKAKIYEMSPEEQAKALKESVEKVIVAIQSVPDDALGIMIDMPWGAQSLEEICAYPYWNISYHLGQTNYIASILECLD